MSKPRKIFLSHSSLDGVLATLLANQIELELAENCVFNSSDDAAVDIGDTWFEKVIKELDAADFLIILLTESSKKSSWVAFEFGYFWHKVDPLQHNKKIYILSHQIEEISSPFSVLQTKKITAYKGLENFFNQLCQNFAGREFSNHADLDAIIGEANKTMIPQSTKSIDNFVEYLEKADWVIIRDDNIKNDPFNYDAPITIWNCSGNTDYEIWIEGQGRYVGAEKRMISYRSRASHKPKNLRTSKVTLKNNGKKIYPELTFLHYPTSESLIPKPELIEGIDKHFWSRSSIIMKVARVIGNVNNAKAKTMDELIDILADPANYLWIEIRD